MTTFRASRPFQHPYYQRKLGLRALRPTFGRYGIIYPSRITGWVIKLNRRDLAYRIFTFAVRWFGRGNKHLPDIRTYWCLPRGGQVTVMRQLSPISPAEENALYALFTVYRETGLLPQNAELTAAMRLVWTVQQLPFLGSDLHSPGNIMWDEKQACYVFSDPVSLQQPFKQVINFCRHVWWPPHTARGRAWWTEKKHRRDIRRARRRIIHPHSKEILRLTIDALSPPP